MFEKSKLMFLYAVSPVHMGAGTAIGVIDNPIQRERHTEYPSLAGSGLKGALRDVYCGEHGEKETNRFFGPSTDDSDHAGAISFADAQLVLFPVRSLKEGFVYATSPDALGRVKRLAEMSLNGNSGKIGWEVPSVASDAALVADQGVLDQGNLYLEAFQIKARVDDQACQAIASWLAEKAFPDGEAFKHFAEKVKKSLVVLGENLFSYFTRNATLVEPHVRIDDKSGTAEDGGLFYTENLPPESLLVSLCMVSKERVGKGTKEGNAETADQIMEKLTQTIGGKLIQVGGDASTGRGQMCPRFY